MGDKINNNIFGLITVQTLNDSHKDKKSNKPDIQQLVQDRPA